MKRGAVALVVVLSLMMATGCVKDNRAKFCSRHPNNAKCR
jgi:hypothetical protein